MPKKKYIGLVMLFAVGVAIMLYPTVSNLWNDYLQQQVVGRYEKTIKADEQQTKKELNRAVEYNAHIGSSVVTDAFSDTEMTVDDVYHSILNINNDDMMGYVEIPEIDVLLPIYHGTNKETLEKGAGHLFGSSLPVGGEGTHAVISAHCGLPTAKLFTHLDELELKDVFYIHVLDETLAYQVDQIVVALPYQTDALAIVEGEDYVTLLTCTPYGVNTHRLLVRGHRISLEKIKGNAGGKEEIKKKLKYKTILLQVVLGVAFIVGASFFFYPFFKEFKLKKETKQVIKYIDDSSMQDKRLDKLYESMKQYNNDLYENGQNLEDTKSYEATPEFYKKNKDKAIGYIEIPDMEIILPLYIGATKEHMKKGASIMTETSMPIGGENTNCVIAGHRGYSGASYFKKIEKLKKKSIIYITNPWEKLKYEVIEIKIINPDDMQEVMIQSGKDMITLVTCHPYMSHGKYRYLVYAQRI